MSTTKSASGQHHSSLEANMRIKFRHPRSHDPCVSASSSVICSSILGPFALTYPPSAVLA